jgi:hypothetical protein
MTLRSPTPDTGQSKVLGPGIEYSTLRTTGKVIANSRDFEGFRHTSRAGQPPRLFRAPRLLDGNFPPSGLLHLVCRGRVTPRPKG